MLYARNRAARQYANAFCHQPAGGRPGGGHGLHTGDTLLAVVVDVLLLLAIARSGDSVIVSWSNAPGFILKGTGDLSANPVWTNLCTQNPHTLPTTGSALFFRVVSP